MATTGSILAALIAGISPANAPMTTKIKIAAKITGRETEGFLKKSASISPR
jgi:hypothetical protein